MMHPNDVNMVLAFVLSICLGFSIPTSREMLPGQLERTCALPQPENTKACRRIAR